MNLKSTFSVHVQILNESIGALHENDGLSVELGWCAGRNLPLTIKKAVAVNSKLCELEL